MTWIVDEQITIVWPSGERGDGRIAIGAPEIRARDCVCTVAVPPLMADTKIFGDSTLQALVLGLQAVGFALHSFVEQGGRIVQGGEELPIDAVLGALYRAPVPRPADDDS